MVVCDFVVNSKKIEIVWKSWPSQEGSKGRGGQVRRGRGTAAMEAGVRPCVRRHRGGPKHGGSSMVHGTHTQDQGGEPRGPPRTQVHRLQDISVQISISVGDVFWRKTFYSSVGAKIINIVTRGNCSSVHFLRVCVGWSPC